MCFLALKKHQPKRMLRIETSKFTQIKDMNHKRKGKEEEKKKINVIKQLAQELQRSSSNHNPWNHLTETANTLPQSNTKEEPTVLVVV